MISVRRWNVFCVIVGDSLSGCAVAIGHLDRLVEPIGLGPTLNGCNEITRIVLTLLDCILA